MRDAPPTSELTAGEFALLCAFARADFDPLTATAATMGLTGLGAGVKAYGSFVGGDYARMAGDAQQAEANFQATQLTEQSATDMAAAQRQAQDKELQTSQAVSTARAGAAFGGVAAGTGSALTNQKNLVGRGEYLAAMDLWSGENKATGDLNAAAAARYGGAIAAAGGRMQQEAGDLAGAGSLIGGFADMANVYRRFTQQ